MDALASFFAMGGYALWIWSAYGAGAVALSVLLASSLRALRSRERALAAAERSTRPRRRPRDAGRDA